MTSRRNFIKKAAMGTAALTVGGVLPGFSAKSYSNIVGANDMIRVGAIGVNSRGMALATNFAKQQGCEITRICDVDSRAIAKCITSIEKAASYKPKGEKDLRKMVESKDVDAVIVATPDHWHQIPVVMAANAKKHIYCEKPLSLTVREARAMVNAVRKNDIIFQTGSQQRSSAEFRQAERLVRNGKIGKIEKVITKEKNLLAQFEREFIEYKTINMELNQLK